MNIFDISDPRQLRDVIDESSRWSPAADALEAECRDALALAPHNRHMRDPHSGLSFKVTGAVRSLRGDSEADGVVPVIRANGTGAETSERTRRGHTPLPRAGVVGYCLSCSASSGALIPFWVAVGQYVVQADLCGSCSYEQIVTFGAVPQVGV